jgi:hypothetical protein
VGVCGQSCIGTSPNGVADVYSRDACHVLSTQTHAPHVRVWIDQSPNRAKRIVATRVCVCERERDLKDSQGVRDHETDHGLAYSLVVMLEQPGQQVEMPPVRHDDVIDALCACACA